MVACFVKTKLLLLPLESSGSQEGPWMVINMRTAPDWDDQCGGQKGHVDRQLVVEDGWFSVARIHWNDQILDIGYVRYEDWSFNGLLDSVACLDHPWTPMSLSGWCPDQWRIGFKIEVMFAPKYEVMHSADTLKFVFRTLSFVLQKSIFHTRFPKCWDVLQPWSAAPWATPSATDPMEEFPVP